LKVSVFGSGAWGTAVALVLHDNGYNVTMWSKFDDEVKELRKSRKNKLLPDVLIPNDITLTSDLSEAVSEAKAVLIVVPSFALRETATAIAKNIDEDAVVICMSKGIEKETCGLFSDILEEVLPDGTMIAVVSGPTHAEEVSKRVPSACVVASSDMSVAMRVQNLLMNKYLRVYTSTDLIGVELGAALKNVIALSAGISTGLGIGDNGIAMLMTRGLAEIAELCMKMGGSKETLAGLAGLGDLIVTCMSEHSRNRRAGRLIGQGMSADEAMKSVGAVVEGYYAASSAKELAELMDVDMPICLETYRVLYEGKSPQKALEDLMSRSRRSEQSTGGELWVIC